MRSLAGLCLLSGITLLQAQGTDRDHPLPLTTPALTGRVAAHEKVELFYRFSAGPGDFRVVVDSLSNSGLFFNTAVSIEDLDAKRVTDVSVDSTGESKRDVGHFQTHHPCELILVLRTNNGPGTYHIRLEGPLNLGTMAARPNSYPPLHANMARQSSDALLQSDTPTLRVVLPRQGLLSIELEDGTVTQIDLQKVRRVSVQP